MTSPVESSLERFRLLLSRGGFSQLELERAAADIDIAYERLAKQEYQKCDFSGNRVNAPGRANDFFVELEFHCWAGKTWERLLRSMGAQSCPEIVDLGAGYWPKVELGLFYMGYAGKVVLINKDGAATGRLMAFLELFKPAFETVAVAEDLYEISRRDYSCVVANHLIDDLVMDYLAPRFGYTMAEIYQSEEKLSDLWSKVLERRGEHLEELLPRLGGIFLSICGNDGWLVISQYASYMQRILEMRESVNFCSELAARTAAYLIERGFRERSQVARSALEGFEGVFKPGDCYCLRREA